MASGRSGADSRPLLGDVTRVRFERLTVQIGPAVVTAPQR